MMLFNCNFWHSFKLSVDTLANYGHTKIIPICAILIFALMLGNVNNTLAGASMKLTENDTGKTVEIAIGDELEIILPANPTTGYDWEVSSIDSSILQSNKADFVANTPAIGAGGLEVIKFQAIATGKSELKLIFHRPFEQNTPPLKNFAVTVIIKK